MVDSLARNQHRAPTDLLELTGNLEAAEASVLRQYSLDEISGLAHVPNAIAEVE